MLRLKNLVESLENKYNLNESNLLNEKFSEDMPDWLVKRLLTTKYTPTSDFSDRDIGGQAHYRSDTRYGYLSSKGEKKNPKFGKEPSYKQQEWGGDQSLFSKMLGKGLNLDTVKVIEGKVPISDTDPRLQSPNIPILLLDNGVVYIPGMNDDEKFGSRKTLGAYDINNLLSRCTKFAYIDGSDSDNFKAKEKRDTRYQNLSGSVYRADGPERDRNYNPLGGRQQTYWSKYDKSGYKIIPPADRYKDKLDEIKAKKIYEIMKEYEDYLTDAQQEIANYISSLSMKEYSSNMETIKKLQTILTDAINYYILADNHINEIVNDNSLNDKDKRDRLIDLINSNWPYRWEGVQELAREIDRLKSASKEVFNSTIDWI